MSINTETPDRLAIYKFLQVNGGLQSARAAFVQLLAAGYHPSLTATKNSDEGESITLIQLPFPEIEAFQIQQRVDQQRWGKPLTYFEFARLNRGTPIEITATDYDYMLGVLPPVYGRGCFAMGELFTHTNTGVAIYYWAAEQQEKFFCLLGTQEEAEREFAPTLLSGTDIARLRELIDRDDIESNATEVLERLLALSVTTSLAIYQTTERSLETTNPWQENEIQFPRLIAEIQATGIINDPTRALLLESMDLEAHELDELFLRAEEESEHIKGNINFSSNLRQNQPAILWTKPLTACGPAADPLVKLHGTVLINGILFHAEAYEVFYTNADHEQVGKQDEEETYLAEICSIVQGAAETIAIADREYVFAILPGQR